MDLSDLLFRNWIAIYYRNEEVICLESEYFDEWSNCVNKITINIYDQRWLNATFRENLYCLNI